MEKICFKFKISPIVWVLIIIVLGLLTTGVVINVKNIIDFWGFDTLDTITFIFTGIMDMALIVTTVVGTINSKYVIANDYIKVITFISTKTIDLNNVTEIVLFRNLQKLVLRFVDGKYTVVVIKKENYQRFIDVLRQKNSKIVYSEENSEK